MHPNTLGLPRDSLINGYYKRYCRRGGALRWFNEQLGGFEQQSAKELDVSPCDQTDARQKI